MDLSVRGKKTYITDLNGVGLRTVSGYYFDVPNIVLSLLDQLIAYL